MGRATAPSNDMATKTITINYGKKLVEVTLRSAKLRDGMRRTEMMMAIKDLADDDPKKPIAFYTYPTCLAAVDSPEEMRSISLDDFIDHVDEADVAKWVQAAYDLNPQWKEGMKLLREMGEKALKEAEKKTSTPSNGSNEPTARPKAVTSRRSKN